MIELPDELRLLEESDAPELYALIDADREHLRRWLPWAGAQDLEGTREFIRLTRRQLADETGVTFAVECDGAIAGVVGVEPLDWTHRSTSIGYWLGERYQGRGLITNAVRAVVEHAVSVWELNRIEIRAAVGNARSRAIPERLGFQRGRDAARGRARRGHRARHRRLLDARGGVARRLTSSM